MLGGAGLTPDIKTFTTALTACARENQLNRALSLIERMYKLEVAPARARAIGRRAGAAGERARRAASAGRGVARTTHAAPARNAPTSHRVPRSRSDGRPADGVVPTDWLADGLGTCGRSE